MFEIVVELFLVGDEFSVDLTVDLLEEVGEQLLEVGLPHEDVGPADLVHLVDLIIGEVVRPKIFVELVLNVAADDLVDVGYAELLELVFQDVLGMAVLPVDIPDLEVVELGD